MARLGFASPGIVPRAEAAAPAYRALVRAGLRRFVNGVRSLPLFLRIEILALAALVVALLASYGAASFYVADPSDPAANLVTRASRVLAACLTVASMALALLAPRLSVRGADQPGLAALPVPRSALAAFRADRLAFLSIPILVLGLGLMLAPVGWRGAEVALGAVAAWIAWLWASSQLVAALDALCLEGRWRPRAAGIAGRAAVFAAVPLVFVLYAGAREATAYIVDVGRVSSFLVTAAIGLVVGAIARFAAVSAGAAAAEAERHLASLLLVRRWKRHRRVARIGARAPRGVAIALVWKDALVGSRMASLRGQWALTLLLLALPIASVLRPGAPPPWVFAGLIVVLGAAAASAAVLLLWYHEQPICVFCLPATRRAHWLAKAAPALTLVLVAALSLTAVAWARSGAHTARVLFLWTGVSGTSLVLAAANLGQASPPRSPLGQNLFGLGLFCCVLVGSVYPGIGWLALAAFALYTLHSLARDPRA